MPDIPEQLARRKIDRLLGASGWIVQDHTAMNIMAGPGIAVREFPLKTGFADYMLYADGKGIGIVEAKPEGHTLTGVEIQSAKYTAGLPNGLPHFGVPLPFAYESTGAVTQFTNGLDPHPRSREDFTFHRPDELMRLAKLGPEQLRARLTQLPALDTTQLWKVQIDAVRNLESSLADIDHSLRRASRLRQSILKQAFEGSLVPHDSASSNASHRDSQRAVAGQL